MSNALAIASVTRVLQDLLNNALVDHDVTGAVGGNITVSALPPDRVLEQNGGSERTQLNLFLHQVRPNSGWRNMDLPTRGSRGELITNPLLPLDLHYLLTAYGESELHSEILLGYAMQILHEHSVLSREAIRAALTGAAVDGRILPPAFQSLSASDLADQVELIKITPETLSVDDMSKVWTAMQTHYRTTAAYEVSVVLIESRQPKRSPLPVLSRGPRNPVTGRDAGVAVRPSLVPPFPTLESIVPPNLQIAGRLGEVITLTGHDLEGDQVTIRFVEPRSRRSLTLAPSGLATADRMEVQLPPDPPTAPVPIGSPLNPANWQVAIYNVIVLIQHAGRPDRETNELPLMLAPRITGIAAALVASIVTFTIDCSPPVRNTQRVFLIVGDREIPAEPIAAVQVTTLTFRAGGLASGTQHVLRLRVDGIESILIDRTVSPPDFDPTQTVTIP